MDEDTGACGSAVSALDPASPSKLRCARTNRRKGRSRSRATVGRHPPVAGRRNDRVDKNTLLSPTTTVRLHPSGPRLQCNSGGFCARRRMKPINGAVIVTRAP